MDDESSPPETGRDPGHETITELAADRTQLAAARTAMAAERTLMAWVRTALAMIGFGFAIYRFLLIFDPEDPAASHLRGTRAVGLFLMGLGTVAVAMGLLEYHSVQSTLKLSPKRYAVIVGILVGALGVVLFVDTLLNHP